jgi:hypothetical protein
MGILYSQWNCASFNQHRRLGFTLLRVGEDAIVFLYDINLRRTDLGTKG